MDPRKQRTMDRLNEAFFGLLQEKGYAAVSVSELCDRAGVRRATFYKHFSSKEDFLLHVLRAFREELVERAYTGGIQVNSIRERCLLLTAHLADFAGKRAAALSRIRLEGGSDTLLFAMAEEVAALLARDLERLSTEDSNEALASFYAFGLVGVFKRNMDRPGSFDKGLFLEEMNPIINRMFPEGQG